MQVPAPAAAAIHEYLRQVDTAVPGLVDALYVTGSIALDDYRTDISDVDLVAVCAEPPSDAALDALTALHRPATPSVDVVYLSPGDLRRDPTTLSPPDSLLGELRRSGGFEANPVVWRVLATRAIPVRGPALSIDDVWYDPDALVRWNLRNLDSYWMARIDEWRRVDPIEARIRHESGLQWLVLGVARLHHTIATHDVTSKTGAGRYALGIVDERWHPVLETSLELRADRAAPLPAPPEMLRDRAIELSEWLVADAHRIAD